jgi:hypothetical protein
MNAEARGEGKLEWASAASNDVTMASWRKRKRYERKEKGS